MGFYRRVCCNVCGERMKYEPKYGFTPLEIVVFLTEYRYPWGVVFHYRCPNRHKRAWFIPSLGDREEVLIYKNYTYPA